MGSARPPVGTAPTAVLRWIGRRGFRIAFTSVVLGAVLVPPRTAAAQGRIAGTVRDTAGAGIAGAEITVAGATLRAVSDGVGAFVLAGLPAGPAAVHVRRLGFAPMSASVSVENGTTVPLTLTVREVARELSPVIVRAQGNHQYTGYLAGFYERRDQGFGRFITGAEIQQRNPMELTDMLRTIP